MKRYTIFQLFLLLFLIVIFSNQVSADQSAPPPGSIRQSLPEECRNLTDCPDHFGGPGQQYYQDKCCPHGHTWHCIAYRDSGGVLHNVGACVDPLTCSAGTYAFLNETVMNGDTYVSAQCVPCEYGHFELDAKPSYDFRYAHCVGVWQHCFPQERGTVETQQGTAHSDRRCRCWWEGGFVPHTRKPECLDLKGFTQADDCHCSLMSCADGHVVDQNYACVPASSLTTSTMTPATSPAPPGSTTILSTPKPHSSKTTSLPAPPIPVIISFTFLVASLPSL